MLKRFVLIFPLLCAVLAAAQAPAAKPASSETIAVRGGKLLTVSHGVIENGVIVMQNGKITAIGAPTRLSQSRPK